MRSIKDGIPEQLATYIGFQFSTEEFETCNRINDRA